LDLILKDLFGKVVVIGRIDDQCAVVVVVVVVVTVVAVVGGIKRIALVLIVLKLCLQCDQESDTE
jgi:hypothetical protein